MYSNDIIEYVFLPILTVHWFIYVKYMNTQYNFPFKTLKFSSFFSYEYIQHYMHDLQHNNDFCLTNTVFTDLFCIWTVLFFYT